MADATEARAESPAQSKAPSRVRLVVAFAALYIIWGSTYLAIRFAIETLPPFLMAGVRFFSAGLILYGWTRWRGAERPVLANWRAASVVGLMLLLGGNGAVVWAEQTVASGTVALLVATVPFWMVLFDWMRGTGSRPGIRTVLGLLLGFVGLGVLLGPEVLSGVALIDPFAAVVVLAGSCAWAYGSIYSRTAPLPDSPLLATAMQMIAGGALLLAAGLIAGEVPQVELNAVSTRSALALLYLVGIGSIVAYTAYVWLLRVSTPARVSTYAYVNPVVAVFLGWALADEMLTPRILLAAAIIVGGVAVVTTARARRARQR